mgnify:CR=1 FL=1
MTGGGRNRREKWMEQSTAVGGPEGAREGWKKRMKHVLNFLSLIHI